MQQPGFGIGLGIEAAIAEVLRAVGEDPQREGLRETPARVARLYAELFSEVGADPAEAIDTVFEADSQDPVALTHLRFFSMCEHHLLPFFGEARMVYVPNGKIAGISKLGRALEVACRRPQVQERLTAQVADAIAARLAPDAVIVELEAEHLCMAMRGLSKPGARMLTTARRGGFQHSPLSYDGLLNLLRGRGN